MEFPGFQHTHKKKPKKTKEGNLEVELTF